MKKTWIVLIVVLFLGSIAGLIAYDRYKNRPEQTIVNIFKALDTKSQKLWSENVAQDTLVRNSYNVYSKQFESKDEDDFFMMVNKLVEGGYASIMERGMIDDINSGINDYFTSDPENLLVFDKEALFQFIEIIDYDSLKIRSVRQNDKNTMIEFSFMDKAYHHSFIISSILEKQNDHWKLIGISNLNQVISIIRDLEKDRRNAAITKRTMEMQHYLEITHYVGVKNDAWFEKYPLLNLIPLVKTSHTIEVTNKSNQMIMKFIVKMIYKDSSGWIEIEKQVNHNEGLAPGQTIKLKFDSYDPFIAARLGMGIMPELTHVSITLESGEVLVNEENKDLKLFE